MVGGSRLRQIGWAMALGVVFTLFMALTFTVNAVKSEVVQAERKIVALKHETMRLETEFQTRANQQQLANWNAVDFGYVAPRADQYLENERQLAGLGEPAVPGAPSPIRVAHAPADRDFPSLTSPFAAEPGEAAPASPAQREVRAAEVAEVSAQPEGPSLAERLGMSVELSSVSRDFAPNAQVAE